MRVFLLTIHIISAGGWIGGNMVQALAATSFKNKGRDARIAWAETSLAMARIYYSVIGALLVVTGILMLTVLTNGYEFSDGFVGVGFLAVIIGAVLGVAVFAPAARKWSAALSSGDDEGATAAESRITLFGAIDTVIIVLTIAAMVAKWGAGS